MAGNEKDESARRSEVEAMRGRLEKLSTALDARRGDSSQGGPSPAHSRPRGDSSGGMAKGLRAASELVAGVLVGGFIGWQLDSWLGTKPWLLIVFFLLGVAAGFWNVMRDAFSPTGGGSSDGRDDNSPSTGA